MVKNLCVHCDQLITAPEDMRGQQIPCPSCGRLNVLMAAEDLTAQVREEHARKRQEDRRLLDITLHDQRTSLKSLRDLSDLLLILSYVLSILIVLAGACPLVLGHWETEGQILAFVVSAVIASLVFVFFKFLSALVQSLSDQLSGQIIVQQQLRDVLAVLEDQSSL